MTQLRLTQLVSAAILAVCYTVSGPVALAGTLFQEDFEELTLGPTVDEGLPGAEVFTATPPEGWTVDNSDLGGGGITEFAGWTFLNQEWYINTAGDQRRSEFTRASGTIAVADPDEYDDSGSRSGDFNSLFVSPVVNVTSLQGTTVSLMFDSSWRPETPQRASISATFDGGAPTDILVFSSDSSSPDFKADNSTNDAITVDIDIPEGADELQLAWGVFDSGNNWYWAIDNINLVGSVGGPADFNDDGVVDTADFDILASNFLTGTTRDQGDYNLDQKVDLQDFVNFVADFQAQPAAVPEPSTFVLLVLGSLGLCARIRRRTR